MTEQKVSKKSGLTPSTEKPVSKMEQLLAESQLTPKYLTKGQIVEGVVVSKNNDQVLVDIGAKAEGFIPSRELGNIDEIKIGDNISAFVIATEGDGGQAVLSVKKAGGEMRWKQLSEKMNKGEAVSVKGIEANRGGIIVESDGLRGFIPTSHLLSSPNSSVGKGMEVKIIEVDKKLNRLVFSERDAHPEDSKLPKIDFQFKESDNLEGKVNKILPFGLLIALPGGVEGLVHISEISWERVGNLEEMYKVGDSVKVKVASIDPGNGKISLSIKKLQEDPWKEAEKKYSLGREIESTINRVSSYGAFVQLEKGIEGLIHSSKIPYGVKLQPGDKVKISIDLFNPEQRRVALRLVTESAPAEKVEKKTKKTKKAEKES
jgi:small subunit ribosomal protein S1